MKKTLDIHYLVLVFILLLVAVWRVFSASLEMTGWTNFSPIGAMAIFSGYYFLNKPKAYFTPICILFMSDVILMQTLFKEYSTGILYDQWYWTYGSFLLMVWVGEAIKRFAPFYSVILGSLLAGLVHFLLSNFGVWVGGGLNVLGIPYPRNIWGLWDCYIQAIPFFKNMLYGNLVFSILLFGLFELLTFSFPRLKKATAK